MRGVLIALAVIALSPVAAPAAPRGAPSPKALASGCALLDSPSAVRRMDGLVHRLAAQCERSDLLGGVAARAGQSGPARQVPGGDVRVNNPTGETGPSKTQSENSVARSEVTGTLCSGFNDSYANVLGQGLTGFSRSADDGATFVDGGALDASSYGDPSMAWRRADGHFYLATLHAGGLAVYRSTDDCQSFELLSLGHVGSGDDKELIAVDNHPDSPFFGRIYLVWTDFADGGRIYATSSDDGVVWNTPVALSAAGAEVQGAWPTVGPDGTVYVGWVRWNPFFSGPMDIELVRSDNGGQSWLVATNPASGVVNPYSAAATVACGRPALNGNIRYLPSPQLAVTPNGDLHVVYSHDPDGHKLGDIVDVFYRRSTDRGQSWLPQQRVNDDATQADQFFPTISAGPTGRIVIGWYDRRLDPVNNLHVDYYAATSDDGGITFGPNERLSDESSPIYLDPGLATCYHGDYDGSVQDAASSYVQWSDDRAVRDGVNDPDAYLDRNIHAADFFLGVTPASATVCAPASASFDVSVNPTLDYPDPITLDVSGHPEGSDVVFSVNPVLAPGTSALAIDTTPATAPGVYDLELSGTANTTVRTLQATLDLATQSPAAPVLQSPAPGAADVDTRPTLNWSAAAQAREYLVEMATDSGFGTVVHAVTTDATTWTADTPLAPDTRYFWRVSASNQCAGGPISEVRSFTTLNRICVTPGLDIPDNVPTGLDSTVVVPGAGMLDDLAVSLQVEHTWVGDLAAVLTHDDTGTQVQLMDRPGYTGAGFGCPYDDIDATLSDAATDPVENACSASAVAVAGVLVPHEPLAAFAGEALTGSWTLNISDNAAIHPGRLSRWCLLPTLVLEDLDSDGVGDALDNCSMAPNADQRDTDGDGIGNVCDADLNNDCVVNVLDLGLLRSAFFGAGPDADLDGDGVVNTVDLGLMRLAFFEPPGPAAEPNVCSAQRR